MNLKRSAFLFILVIFVEINYFESAMAWNFTGHVVIAQIAYNNLETDNKNKVDFLANKIFFQLSKKQQQKLNNQYNNASTFAKLAVLPDYWRNWKVETIFKKFNAQLPPNLLPYASEKLASWHFKDRPFPSNKFCGNENKTNVLWAISALTTDFKDAKDSNTAAILLILINHFMGDIHQPLHTITNVTLNCKGDDGGNHFCLKINKKGQCSKNLHMLWDGGVGFLKSHSNIQKIAYRLQNRYPASAYSHKTQDIDLNNWLNDTNQYSTFIYALNPQTPVPMAYYKEGQRIASSQIALAGYRLGQEVNRIVNPHLWLP